LPSPPWEGLGLLGDFRYPGTDPVPGGGSGPCSGEDLLLEKGFGAVYMAGQFPGNRAPGPGCSSSRSLPGPERNAELCRRHRRRMVAVCSATRRMKKKWADGKFSMKASRLFERGFFACSKGKVAELFPRRTGHDFPFRRPGERRSDGRFPGRGRRGPRGLCRRWLFFQGR
jgi:hypothetical protein